LNLFRQAVIFYTKDMRITVPKRIKEELALIESVCVEMDDTTQPGTDTLKVHVNKLHFEKMEFVNIFDQQWQNCSFVQYRLKYLNGREEVIVFESKEKANYKPLDDLGVFLEGKDMFVGSYFDTCPAADSIAKNNLFCFETIKDIPAYVVNLDQDIDRYLKVKDTLGNLGFSNVCRWTAVDARKSDRQDMLQYYGVRTTSSFNNVGAIGCSLSHLSLYEDFLSSGEAYRLIFEDDVTPHSRFHELLASVNNLSLDSFDILFLGGWFWGFGEKDSVKNIQEALALSKQTNFLRNPTSFETHAMLISRRFAYKAVDNYRRRQSSGSLLIDNYITQSKYFDTCLLTFSPFDSSNVDKLQLRNMNNCGLFFQTNVYGSHIQRKDIQGRIPL
jgi:GR25 family glycosyltransferase involved in LPS biosynthesis